MSLSAETEDATVVETAAVRLLASREHSRYELEQKLRRRGHAPDLLASTLDDLQHRGLLSDERFVAGYVQQRVRKGYGPLRLRAELSERGVADAVIEQGLEVAAIDWQALLNHVAERRFGADDPADRNALVRRARHLEQRGFPISLVRRYLNGLHAAN
jgi:regulatory protein